ARAAKPSAASPSPRCCPDLASIWGRVSSLAAGVVNRVLQLRCDCGFEACAADEEGLVAQVQRHAWEAHGMSLSHDDALLLAFRAELDEAHITASPQRTTHKDEEER